MMATPPLGHIVIQQTISCGGIRGHQNQEKRCVHSSPSSTFWLHLLKEFFKIDNNQLFHMLKLNTNRYCMKKRMANEGAFGINQSGHAPNSWIFIACFPRLNERRRRLRGCFLAGRLRLADGPFTSAQQSPQPISVRRAQVVATPATGRSMRFSFLRYRCSGTVTKTFDISLLSWRHKRLRCRDGSLQTEWCDDVPR